MITPNTTRIFLCTQDTDMRKSFNSLCGVVRGSMHLNPLSGYLFVFKNKRADRIKALYWDRDGLAIWYKVLQKGTFKFPSLQNISSAGLEIDASTLRLILDGIDLSKIRHRQRFLLEPDFDKDKHRDVPEPPGTNLHRHDGFDPEHHI